MTTDWQIIESGPADAERTVLLLPGGMNSARSYAEVMAEPALAGVRLVAVTMPGQAGAAAPEQYSVEHYAAITAELAKRERVDVIVGFSMGAVVACEMVMSGAFAGPVVLLGLSMSTRDEPAFFRAIVRLGAVLGTLPVAVLKAGAASMAKHAPLPDERRAELAADFARNDAREVRASLHAYLQWLHADDDRARRLCESRVPAWVVHAEKGDGGLTDHERAVLDGCPTTTVVRIPGKVFFLPNEIPAQVAQFVTDALAAC